MAKKRPYKPPPKESKKAHFGSLSKDLVKELTGYRPVSAAEKKRLGIKTSTRAYTTQKIGVKKLDKSKIAPRRRVEERTLEMLHGSKVRFEEKAARNFEARGLRSPFDRYHRIRKLYIESKYHGPTFVKNTKNGPKEILPAKVSVIKTDAEFKLLYKRLKNTSKKRGPTIQRLRALKEIYGDDPFADYLQTYKAVTT